jgi:deoxyinosine 3'endonuclease (endonuclease V)
MEAGGRPERGVCAAVDVHYPSTGGARAAGVLAADAAFAHVLAERTAVVPRVPPYQPGQFYLRELPPLRAILDDLSDLGLLVVDGYAAFFDFVAKELPEVLTRWDEYRASGPAGPG